MASFSSDDKKAEFAKLFDLFEMLAMRRSRMTATQSLLDDTHTIPVPAELEPVFRSLATVIPPRSQRSGRFRRNTVAALGRTNPYPDTDGDASGSDSEVEGESVAKFPLGKTYTFTFKMMIHKLSSTSDEWAEKVREVLKRSQIDYKPLAEQRLVSKAVSTATPADGHVHFKGEVTVGGKKSSMPLAKGRVRSHSVAGKVAPPSSVHRSQGPAGTLHAVKKRCIGRRKSITGVFSAAAPVGDGWFYDAAVSSTEVRERVPIETTASFVAAPGPRPRYQSLQTGSRRMGPETGSGPRRIVSAVTTTVDAKATLASASRTSTKRRLSQG
ncbi:hypothetical protein DFH07DRAFT_1014941 [Mycena maculata]|uniref:Uncharacterized protein n=1 Tax=Mycena maculata TaxID=230809 RepID=A0AAD7JI95_9AGAR|nr:hypothetical protein DFH07DRAFT_1014941 [Mycena maculata]